MSVDNETMDTRPVDVTVEQAAEAYLSPSYILSLVVFLALLPAFWISRYTPSGAQIASGIIGAAFVAYWPTMIKDPYGLFHLTLNKLPREDPSVPPQTEWLNMGFWRVSDATYPPSTMN